MPYSVNTGIEGNDVVIMWAAPSDNGSPITGYQVFIKAYYGDFLEYTSFTGTGTDCTVPFSDLKNDPYYLA